MCVLCEHKVYTENNLNQWLMKSSYDDTMPQNIIYKDIWDKINNFYWE